MKHFFKRVNRGIVLAVVLLVGLAVFIWQDESSFQKEKPAIEQTVTSYLNVMSKINTTDTNLQKIGTAMTNEQQKAKLQEFTKNIDQYWIDSTKENDLTKARLLQQLNEMVTQNSKGKGYIQKFTVKVNGTPTVKKTGPSNATANISYDAVIEYAGSPMYLLGGYVDSASHFSSMGKEDSSKAATETARKRYTINVQADAELEKTGDSWKIVSMYGGGGSNGGPVDIE